MKDSVSTAPAKDRRRLRAQLKYIRAKIRAAQAAMHAYTTCEVLDARTRKRLARLTEACRLTATKAIRVVVSFAQGYLEDLYSWDLVQAWLRLGEEVFQRVYRMVRPKPCYDLGPEQ